MASFEVYVNSRIKSAAFLLSKLSPLVSDGDKAHCEHSVAAKVLKGLGIISIPNIVSGSLEPSRGISIVVVGDHMDSVRVSCLSTKYHERLIVVKVVPSPRMAIELASKAIIAGADPLAVGSDLRREVIETSDGKLKLLQQNPKTTSVFAKAVNNGWLVFWVLKHPSFVYTGDVLWMSPDGVLGIGTKAQLKDLILGQCSLGI